MKNKILLVISSILFSTVIFSQSVGINTNAPHNSAILDIQSNDKGMLVPRMNSAQRTGIGSPAVGLLVYDTDTNGFWFYNGAVWTNLSAAGWLLNGNSGINPASNFIGTTDGQPLRFRVNNGWAGEIQSASGNLFLGLGAGKTNTGGILNTAMGSGALANNTNSNNNVAIGDSSLFSQNGPVNTGVNTAVGTHSLYKNTNGTANTAVGGYALYSNVDGGYNTSIGLNSMSNNISGDSNTAIGSRALQFNNSGNYNTADRATALRLNTIGKYNTAFGFEALYGGIDDVNNTAIGVRALYYGGGFCTATGMNALYNNTFIGNTATGYNALFKNTTGFYNTAVGMEALYNNIDGNFNTALGRTADVALPGYSNATAIGYGAIVNSSSKMQLGNTITIAIATSGGYTIASDGRFKENMRDDVPGLDFIMKLQPLTYNFNYTNYDQFIKPTADIAARASFAEKADPIVQQKEAAVKLIYQRQLAVRSSKRETGFVAQDVERAVRESGYTAFNGVYAPTNAKDNYALDYSKMVVPLVKAMQEQQAIINRLQQQIDLQEKRLAALEAKKIIQIVN